MSTNAVTKAAGIMQFVAKLSGNQQAPPRDSRRSTSTVSTATSAAASDAAMEVAPPTTQSIFAGLSDLGTDLIDQFTQSARVTGHALSNARSSRRRLLPPEDAADADGAAFAAGNPCPFDNDQTYWLDSLVSECVSGTMKAGMEEYAKIFGRKVQERCAMLEVIVNEVKEDAVVTAIKVQEVELSVAQLMIEVDRLRADLAAQSADAAALRSAAAASAALDSKMELMSQQIVDARARIDAAPVAAPSGSASSGSSAPSGASKPAWESRTSFILMNLIEPIPHGESPSDIDRKERMARCLKKGEEVLLQCGVLPASYSTVSSMANARGCDIEFTSHAAGMYARSKVIATALSFYEVDTKRVPVWCDVGKTRDEMKPSRMTHRCQDVMTNFEKEKDDPRNVLKC